MLMITGLDSLTSIHWSDDDTWCVFLSIVRLFHFSFIYMLSNHNSSFLKVLYIVKKDSSTIQRNPNKQMNLYKHACGESGRKKTPF